MCSIMQAFPWRASVGTINGCSARFVHPDAAFQQTSEDSNADSLTAALPTTVHEDTWLVRLDHKFSEKTLLYARAQPAISLVDGPNGGSLPDDKIQILNHPPNTFLAPHPPLTT